MKRILLLGLLLIGVVCALKRAGPNKVPVASLYTYKNGFGFPRVSTNNNSNNNNSKPHPGARAEHGVVNLLNKFFLYGGRTILDKTGAPVYTSDLWEYDKIKGEWSWLRGPLDDLFYPPTINTCSFLSRYSPGRRVGYVMGHSGSPFIFGGQVVNSDGSLSEPLNDKWVFADCWDFQGGGPVPINDYPSPRVNAKSAIASLASTTFIFGGYNSSTSTDFMQEIWWAFGTNFTKLWQVDINSQTNYPSFPSSTVGTNGDVIFSRLYPDASVWAANDFIYYFSQDGFWGFQVNTSQWVFISSSSRTYSMLPNDDSCTTCSPGPRRNAITWMVIGSTDLWLQGGYVDDKWLNDTWRYDTLLAVWIWVRGDSDLHDKPDLVPAQYQCYFDCYYYGASKDSTTLSSKLVKLSAEGEVQVEKEFIDNLVIPESFRTTTTIPSHPSSLSGASVVTIGSNVYVVCGYSSSLDKQTNEIWMYSTTNGTWTLLNNNVFDAQSTPVTFAFNNRIYLLNSYKTLKNNLVVYDVTTGTNFAYEYAPVSTMFPSLRHNALYWFDGTVLWMFGGRGYGATNDTLGILSDLWKYNPTVNAWTKMSGNSVLNQAPTSNMPGGRHSGSLVGDGKVLYMYGGYTTSTSDYSIWMYNISANSWSFVVNVAAASYYPELYYSNLLATPGQRTLGSLFYAYNYLFLFGGQIIGSNYYENDMWAFDLSSLQWYWIEGSNSSTVASPPPYLDSSNPAGRMNFGSVQNGSVAWFYGGNGIISGNYESTFADLWSIDFWTIIVSNSKPTANHISGDYISVNFFTPADHSGPGARARAAACSHNDNTAFLYGGYSISVAMELNSVLMSDLWRYVNGTWTVEFGRYNTTTNDSPGPRGNSILFCNSALGKLLLYGGHNTNIEAYGDMWLYDIQLKKWERIAGSNETWSSDNINIPSSRIWAAYAVTSTSIYLYGGLHQSDALSDLWKYDVASNTWTKLKDEGVNSTTIIQPINNIISPGSRVNSSLIVQENTGYTIFWLYSGGDPINESLDANMFLYDTRQPAQWNNIAISGFTYPEEGLNHTCNICSPGNRSPAGATWIDGTNIFLYGGANTNPSLTLNYSSSSYPIYTDLWRFDITNNSWYWQWGANSSLTRNASDPILLITSASAVLGKKMLIYGGVDYGRKLSSNLYTFDFSNPVSITLDTKISRIEPVYPLNFDSVVRPHPASSSGLLHEYNGTLVYYSQNFVDFYNSIFPSDSKVWSFNATDTSWQYNGYVFDYASNKTAESA